MKRRIRKNIWDNWYGYLGNKRVIEFGTDEADAKEWLETGKIEKVEIPQIIRIKRYNSDL